MIAGRRDSDLDFSLFGSFGGSKEFERLSKMTKAK